MRILVVDDDRNIRELLKKHLQMESFVVDTAGNGEDGSYMARTHNYDLVILDNIMPKKNALEVCKDVRSSGKSTPLLILASEMEVAEKIMLLNAGVDGYVAKPLIFRELLAQIRAILRRPALIVLPTLRAGDLVLDTMNQKARRGKQEIYLTRKEFALTEYLMRHAGSVVSRSTLMEHVWDDDLDPFSNTIEAHILNLRKKLDNKGKKKIIQTVPGRGYIIQGDQSSVFE